MEGNLKEDGTGSDLPVTSSKDHEEHVRLAGIIKGVHANLRKKYKNNTSDLEKIWQEHCQNKSVLCAYADAMHHLAVDHWTKNQETRIDWCRSAINEYFHHNGLEKVLAKERRKREHEIERGNNEPDQDIHKESTEVSSKMGVYNTVQLPLQGKIRLLDVGSCFNPFLAYPEFQAVGIDISPATKSVFRCDFLGLRTMEPLQVTTETMDTMTTFLNDLSDPIDCLPRDSFHVVVFSLLLEYFPAAHQRWLCCQKAQELLMYNGVLVVITPDSSHQNRNANMIRSWRIAIQSRGFQRVRYEKLEHLHCMIFRKVELTEHEKRENVVKDVTSDMMYIPQDYNNGPLEDNVEYTSEYTAEDEEFYREQVLDELPHFSADSE